MSVVTRFPPSPTGHLHLGGARTAIINWIYARQNDGNFIVRMEDTDKERSSLEFETSILNSLAWFGLDFEGSVIRQSDSALHHREIISQLLDSGKAYRCICSTERLDQLRCEQREAGIKPRYDRRCRDRKIPSNVDKPFVVRLKIPESGSVKFADLVQGSVEYRNAELDDMIIARSDGSPTYHLSSVVDDIEAKVSHIIRGDDHLNNTPRQIHIFNALNTQIPVYGHIPLLHSVDGKKLSKRSGLGNVLTLSEEGILPNALLNYLTNIGWSGSDAEVHDKEKLLAEFDLPSISKSSARFDINKLYWFNQQHIVMSPPSSLVKVFKTFVEESERFDQSFFEKVIALYVGRANTLKDMAEKSFFFFQKPSIFDSKARRKFINPQALNILSEAVSRLQDLDDWNSQSIEGELKRIVAENDIAFPMLGQPIRIALSGGTNSPDISQTLNILGRNESLDRMCFAAENLRS